ncbi:MAG: winged helix-turn-helix domain-containing protein [Cytophagaceae bacterium]|jgi:transposase|nr:winged helix-turn-helix domain-containing protein [Cytophagaceae bacterium]
MRYELPVSDMETLRRYQRNVRGKEYIKATTLLMLAKCYSPENVSECLGIDASTVYRYWALFREVGLDSFLEKRHKGYWCMLTSREITVLRSELSCLIYTDSKSVALLIKASLGVEYTNKGIVDLLNRIGFTYKKTKEVPCECEADKQEAFTSELSELFDNLDDNTVVYYADGVHPTHNSRSTYA